MPTRLLTTIVLLIIGVAGSLDVYLPLAILTAHCALLTTHCLPLTTHCLLLTTHCLLMTTHCLLLTTLLARWRAMPARLLTTYRLLTYRLLT